MLKKTYFKRLLDDQKQNSKETWNVLNTIINKERRETSYPDCFETDGKQITNNNDIANGFNIFFANIGKELAAK